MSADCDLLIVGGGINGTAIARAAALGGQRVLLVERGDLAQATSSASTKLMHGGLRYLEQFEFKLVGEALRERATMLRTAPHIVRPIEFHILPGAAARSFAVLRIGLWLYDLLAIGGRLPRSRSATIADDSLKASGRRALSYWDGWVDDARLVVLNAVDAAEVGAEILTRTVFHTAIREGDVWRALLETPRGARAVSAAAIVNAAGPWVDESLHRCFGRRGPRHIRLVRGSHILVDRLSDTAQASLMQQPDGRIVFAIPYLCDFTLIGTTDVPVGTPEDDATSPAEIDYLLAAANRYLRNPLQRADVVASYAGVRALYDDGAANPSAVSRDYRLELDADGPPLLSVFGGKITTARHLAEVALRRLGLRAGPTRDRPLPGGDIADFASFLANVRSRWPDLDASTAERMAHAYGTRITAVLGDATASGDDFGAGLGKREVDYLIGREWARSAEDVLWRRTKLGYRLTAGQVEALEAYVRTRTP